jgi:hypothetical protein
MAEMRNAYRIIVEKLEKKRQLRRPSCRWEDNTETGLSEIGIHLAQNRGQWRKLVNKVTGLQVPQNMWNFLTNLATRKVAGQVFFCLLNFYNKWWDTKFSTTK